MASAISVAGIEVEPGQRAMREVAAPVGGRAVTVPIIAINGAADGPHVAITGGIHGAEYVGIEAARRLGVGIDPREVSGSIVVVPIANTTAFHARAIYTSGLDDRNLNRQFPGDAHGAPSEALADWLFEHIIRPSRYYIDLHGGDMIEALAPFVIYLGTEDAEVERTSREMALATGIPRVIRSVTAGSTYGAATAAGIPSILAEIGGQGVWSEEEVSAHQEGALRALRYLRVCPAASRSTTSAPSMTPSPGCARRPTGCSTPRCGWARPSRKGSRSGASRTTSARSVSASPPSWGARSASW